MASKTIELEGIGPVLLVKRAQSRSLRLSVTASGVRVSIPRWTPFAAGQAFALSHTDWILRELSKQARPQLISGQRVGKLHYIRFEHVLSGQTATSRVSATEIVIRMHPSETSGSPTVQQRAHTASVRALKREAERLLPPRLSALAQKHDKRYASVSIKQLKRRWGSCDSHQAIALNLYLMELPWEYIDYVLLHELAHTTEMNHGEDFWHTLTAMEPRAKDLSRTLRKHQPVLGTWQS